MNSGNEWIRSRFKWWVKAGLLCLFLGGHYWGEARAGSVVLGWDHNTESDLAGYYLYSGAVSGQYTQKIDVGLTNQYTVTHLLEATPYYFVVTAYNDSGLESDPSNEVYVFIPRRTNQPPVIEAPSTWIAEENQVFETRLTVSDPDSAPEELMVWAVPRTPLVSAAALLITGGGNTWDLQFSAVTNVYGTGAIDVFASDGVTTNTTTLFLNVPPVSGVSVPTLNPIPDLHVLDHAGVHTVVLSGISSGALQEGQLVTVAAVSSRPEILPHPTVLYVSPLRHGALRVAPRPGIFGTATVTVIVSGREPGEATFSRAFNVTVQPLRLLSATRTPSGVQLSWRSVPGCVYQVWGKAVVGPATWHEVSPEITASGAVTTWLAPVGEAAEFYQMRFLR